MSEHEGGNLIHLEKFREKKLIEQGDNFDAHKKRTYVLARRTLGLLRSLRVNTGSGSNIQDRYENDQIQSIDEKVPNENGNLINYSVLKSGFHNFVIATQISVEEDGIFRDIVQNISVTTGSKPVIFYSSTAAHKTPDDSYTIYRQVTYQNSSEAYKLSMEAVDKIKANSK